MEYEYLVITGILLSIGWHLGKIVYEVAAELLFSRLHKTEWYQLAAGRKPRETGEQPGDIKAIKNKIGFY